MIVATAGHVDHGKTSLVLALTGFDTDRLPEEKRRGMTIEPGFAYADLGGPEPLAFVDLPGHERFVRHMLSGVSAVDAALLVIAADDGPMPQTLEHLAVLDLLGLDRGVVALTKLDRVEPDRVDGLRRTIASMLSGSSLAGAPVFALSNRTGEGIDALKTHLVALQQGLPRREGGFHARLAVDRCFSRPGAGLVVAGALLSGRVQAGDKLVASPSGTAVRVRSLQVHGRDVQAADAGQRCALNLVSAAGGPIQLERGGWVVAAAVHAPTTRLDVELRWLVTSPRPLAADTMLQLHLGATMRTVRAVPLSGRRIEPGETGPAQLVLDAPVHALRGDRFVLRDAAAQRIVGGGRVLDPFAPARGRARPARLTDLATLTLDAPRSALAQLLANHPEGVEWLPFAQAWNLSLGALGDWALPLRCVAHARGLRLISQDTWLALQARVTEVLATAHAEQPDRVGLPEATLLQVMGGVADTALRRAALREQLAQGIVLRDGFLLRLPDHEPRLQPEDEALLARLLAIMQPQGLRPLPPGELAVLLDMDLKPLSDFLQRAAALGHLVQVARNRFFLPATIDTLVEVARECAAAVPDGRFDAKSFRDRSGIGRNLTIQLLEFFDRSGITRYAAERRSMAPADGP